MISLGPPPTPDLQASQTAAPRVRMLPAPELTRALITTLFMPCDLIVAAPRCLFSTRAGLLPHARHELTRFAIRLAASKLKFSTPLSPLNALSSGAAFMLLARLEARLEESASPNSFNDFVGTPWSKIRHVAFSGDLSPRKQSMSTATAPQRRLQLWPVSRL